MTDRRRLTAVAALAVVVAGGGVALGNPFATPPTVALASPSPSAAPTSVPTPTRAPTPRPTPTPEPTPTPLPEGIADLTGLHVDDALAHRLPIAVLIDDNRVARPQSGFNGASLVYQAPADGGETRYMFVYQEGESRDIGPVRSGRIYFLHWASEIRPAIAHYGGDKISRDYFKAHDGRLFTDVDALRTSSTPFRRISSRRAPHNAYTSTAALRSAARALDGPETMGADLYRRPFRDESPAAGRGTKQAIRIPYRTGVVQYAYDPASNLYLRSLDGRAQVDPADRNRVTTRNVVVLFQPFRIDTKLEPGHARPVVGSIGEGRALVFSEGRAIEATWRKPGETDATRLFDGAGAEISLVRGRTFFQVVPTDTKIGVTG